VKLSWLPNDAGSSYYKIEFLIDGDFKEGTDLCDEFGADE
jgi:hypothetical protein